MKINPVGSNQTEIEKEGGIIVLFSYRTPVAAFVPGRGGLATSQKWSNTTSRHIAKAMERWGCRKTIVSQAEIESIANQAR